MYDFEVDVVNVKLMNGFGIDGMKLMDEFEVDG